MVSRHGMLRIAGLCLFSLLVLTAAGAYADEPPVDIGQRLELLVDTYLVGHMQGEAGLRLHHPARREIAIVHDAPWEGNGGGYHTVFQDGAVYRMYYHAWQTPLTGEQTHPLYIAYAESPDGIHWVKPNLGLVAFNGSGDTNILLAEINGGECHDFSPFKDANPQAAPGEQYKAIGLGRNPPGLYAFKSSDAIHWTLCSDTPVMTGHPFDTQNITFWDPTIGKYRAYIRDFDNGCRGIMTATSDDYLHWTEREWLVFPDAPKEQLYTNQVRPYYRAGHILIGFPSRYVDRGWTPATRALPSLDLREQRAGTSERYGTAVTDALFMTSRDGRTFHRWDEAFIRPGLRTQHNWAYGDNYVAWHVVETDSTDDDSPRELSLYATESYFTGDSSRLRRYAMRIDGFASIFAPLGGGEVTTKPLTFSGDRLTLNCSTSAGGSIRVAIEDPAGNPISGYALDDCDEIFGDALEYTVQWRGNTSTTPLAGQSVRLRFALKDADVFALRFAGPVPPEN